MSYRCRECGYRPDGPLNCAMCHAQSSMDEVASSRADVILAALRADPARAWEIIPSIKVAGPWTRQPRGGWARMTSYGGVIVGGGPTAWALGRSDDYARADGWLLVGGLPTEGLDPEHGVEVSDGNGHRFICCEPVGHTWACRGEQDGKIYSAHNAPVRWPK